MSVFAVILDKSDKEVSERIKNAFPDSFQFKDDVFFVNSDQLSGDVAGVIGIQGYGDKDDDEGDKISGAVFRLNSSYAGFTDRSLWEWFLKAEKQG